VRVAERLMPVMAALSAVATLACCLPVGGAALLGVGGLLGVAAQYQAWLFPASGVLLAVGGILIWRSRRTCRRSSKVSLIILALSIVIVLTVLLFPQMVAGVLTDWLS
jgi:cytochrome bd-type quinol oxidase subunit 2